MQTLHGYRASKTVLRYVSNDREVLVYIQTTLINMNAHESADNYVPIIAKLRDQVRATFSPHLNVVGFDTETFGEIEEFTDHVTIHVQTNDMAAIH